MRLSLLLRGPPEGLNFLGLLFTKGCKASLGLLSSHPDVDRGAALLGPQHLLFEISCCCQPQCIFCKDLRQALTKLYFSLVWYGTSRPADAQVGDGVILKALVVLASTQDAASQCQAVPASKFAGISTCGLPAPH